MADDKKRISVVTEKNKSISTFPVTGAWGGLTPDGGNVVAHFYVEYSSIPNSIEVDYEEGQPFNPNLGNQIKRGDITREIQTNLVMTPEQAVRIGEWLKNHGLRAIEKKGN